MNKVLTRIVRHFLDKYKEPTGGVPKSSRFGDLIQTRQYSRAGEMGIMEVIDGWVERIEIASVEDDVMQCKRLVAGEWECRVSAASDVLNERSITLAQSDLLISRLVGTLTGTTCRYRYRGGRSWAYDLGAGGQRNFAGD